MCSNKHVSQQKFPTFIPKIYIFLNENENENEKKKLNIDKWKKKLVTDKF
jgi:hypothetical protein